MTDEQFCLIHTEFTGEKTTSIQQIVLESFSGEELKEYVEFHMKYRDTLPNRIPNPEHCDSKPLCEDRFCLKGERCNYDTRIE